MKVYVVFAGSYPEDRYIFGIYSSRELAEKAIENYQAVISGSYLDEYLEIQEFDVDDNVDFYGDKRYHFDRNGRYIGEYDGFSVRTKPFDPYVEEFGNEYLVHVCVKSYFEDKFSEAYDVLRDYLEKCR